MLDVNIKKMTAGDMKCTHKASGGYTHFGGVCRLVLLQKEKQKTPA